MCAASPHLKRSKSIAVWGLALSVICVLTACSRREVQTANQMASVPGAPLTLFDTQPIGASFSAPPKISHVQLVDLDQDGRLDVVVCDCERNLVSWIRQGADGEFTEIILQDGLIAPARVEIVDFDQDGDLDIFVAVLGMLFPNNDKIGSLVALENRGPDAQGALVFQSHVLLENVARVSDVRAGDLDEDGKLDLAVTHFGYDQGELRWMQNLGDWSFRSHMLQELPGGIHGVIADLNGDSHLDITVLISQEFEEIYLFAGDGKGNFQEQKLYAAGNEDFGSSGLWIEDLDQDGDLDILFTNGDAYDYSPPHPWPWHGVQWLENRGAEGYRYQRLAALGGAVCARPVDFNGDGDLDIFVSSTFNDWDSPESQSLILLENQGNMQFIQHDLANSPSHIQTMGVGDIDGDGILDLVTGGMHVSEPYDRVERILLWKGLRTTLAP